MMTGIVREKHLMAQTWVGGAVVALFLLVAIAPFFIVAGISGNR
jgi:hypothetical protein